MWNDQIMTVFILNYMSANDMVGGKSWFGWLFNRSTNKRQPLGLLTPLQVTKIIPIKLNFYKKKNHVS